MSDQDKYRAEKERSDAELASGGLIGTEAIKAGLLKQIESADFWANNLADTDPARAEASRAYADELRKSLAKLG